MARMSGRPPLPPDPATPLRTTAAAGDGDGTGDVASGLGVSPGEGEAAGVGPGVGVGLGLGLGDGGELAGAVGGGNGWVTGAAFVAVGATAGTWLEAGGGALGDTSTVGGPGPFTWSTTSISACMAE